MEENELKAKELANDQTEQVTGGASKEEAIHAIDNIIKYIMGPVGMDMESHFGKTDPSAPGAEPEKKHG